MNAKAELLGMLDNVTDIKCAMIEFGYGINNKTIILKENYSDTDIVMFLHNLNNIEYDNGYGTQMLDGTVWLNDGTWLERGEYDGSEWWEHRFLPEIHKELK